MSNWLMLIASLLMLGYSSPVKAGETLPPGTECTWPDNSSLNSNFVEFKTLRICLDEEEFRAVYQAVLQGEAAMAEVEILRAQAFAETPRPVPWSIVVGGFVVGVALTGGLVLAVDQL